LTECAFRREAAYQAEFRRLFADDPSIIIPEVFPSLTIDAVLTME